jgi:hypothetical protein
VSGTGRVNWVLEDKEYSRYWMQISGEALHFVQER